MTVMLLPAYLPCHNFGHYASFSRPFHHRIVPAARTSFRILVLDPRNLVIQGKVIGCQVEGSRCFMRVHYQRNIYSYKRGKIVGLHTFQSMRNLSDVDLLKKSQKKMFFRNHYGFLRNNVCYCKFHSFNLFLISFWIAISKSING